MKTRVLCIFAVFLSLLAFAGCAEKKEDDFKVPPGKTYIYSGEPFSGLENEPFSVTLFEDGTFTYYESPLSSYIGSGKWSEDNGIVTLTENSEPERVNRFCYDGDDLVFIADRSDNFIYIKVSDGERFCVG